VDYHFNIKNMENNQNNNSDNKKSTQNTAGKFNNAQSNEKRRGGKFRKESREKPEFEQQLVDLARVTRVTKGGKQMSFRALVVIGNKKGEVSYGVAKGKDVTLAVGKAVDQAKKIMIKVPLTKDGSIPHAIKHKFKSARILLKPAPKGTGVKSGGAVRVILDMAGIENVVSKIFGTTNKINNVKCAYEALTLLKKPRQSKKEKVKEEKSE
jgi:small subunit ribosomal protein S5